MSYTRTEGRPDTARVIPQFYMDAIEDPIASRKEGRECWRSVERVRLIIPGSPNQPVENVNDFHRTEYRAEYEKFKAGESEVANGIPLEQWPALKKQHVLELKALNFRTVEDCAGMSDTVMQRVPFGMRIRDLAKAYLDDAYSQAELNKAMAERDARTAEVAELRAKVDELSALLARVHTDMAQLRDRPSDIATAVPSHMDPVARSMPTYASDDGARSSLADLPAPRRRGRPTNAEIAARSGPGES